MKRVLAMFMALVLLTANIPQIVAAETRYTEGDYVYSIRYEEAYIWDSDNDMSGDIVIPATLGGYPVTTIQQLAFAEQGGLKSITVPEGVFYIGSGAFQDCYNLTSVTIPDSVTIIGDHLFDGCRSLTSVNIPNNITRIGTRMFTSCIRLPEIVIPDGVSSIGALAFQDCVDMTKITIPVSVTSIEYDAFRRCISLTDVYYNGTLAQWNAIEIGTNNEALTNATIHYNEPAEPEETVVASGTCGENVTWSLNDEGILTISGTGAMTSTPWSDYNTAINSVIIEDGVTTIADSAFTYCSNLTSVTIADSVTSIGDSAFTYCSRLTGIEIPDSVTSMGSFTFSYCDNLTDIKLPASLTSIGYEAFLYCTKLKSVELPDSVTSIGSYAFSRCYSLETVTIPNGVTSIGHSAFYECSSLKKVEIPDSVTSIGNEAFMWCSGLESVTIGNGVTAIGNAVFNGCGKLTDLTIGSSVTTIGDDAFFGCSSLKKVEIPDSVTSIGNEAFIWCSGLESVTIGNGVTAIGNAVFNGCGKLTDLTIGSSVTTIGDDAFFGCSSLESVKLPDGVTGIGSYAFRYCSSMTNITIPDSITTIGYSAFSNCSSLTDVYYGGTQEQWNAMYIGSGNDPLLNATIHYTEPARPVIVASGTCGDNLTWTLDDAGTLTISGTGTMKEFVGTSSPWFRKRGAISSVVIESGVTNVGSNAFNGCSNITSVTIPSGVTSIGERAFFSCNYLTSIAIPDGVTSIGDYAFEFAGLTAITIPSTINNIGNNVFGYCSNLKSVTIPENVISIGDYAFYDCAALTDVYYDGTMAQWNAIEIGTHNEALTNATIHTIDAVEPTLVDVSIKTLPNKTKYWMGEELDTTGLTLTLHYSDGSTKDITEGFNIESWFDPWMYGLYMVYVEYEGYSTSFEVTVVGLTGLSVKTLPDKTEYWTGESLDTTGLILTLHYSDGSTKDITEGFTVGWFDPWMYGTQSVYVEYEGYSTSFDVTVIGVTGLSVKTLPDKTTYRIGEEVDFTGLSVVVQYSDGSIMDVTNEIQIGWYDSWMYGTQPICVTYNGYETSFEVTFVGMTGISVKTLPNKTEYWIGEYLDTTGLVLSLHYSDGTTQDITNDFLVHSDHLWTSGTQSITVEYSGFYTSFDVTVVSIVNVSVKTLPDKTEYFSREELDLTGLTLTITYSNGIQKDVTDGYYVDHYDLWELGWQTIVVYYDWCSTSFEINVVPGGSCGENATWRIDDGVLTISGTGMIYCTWEDWAGSVTSVVINEGITSIDMRAFAYCNYMGEITLPSTLTEVYMSAFESCYNLYAVYYGGSKEQKDKIQIYEWNEYLLRATWYCATVAEHEYNGVKTQYDSLNDALSAGTGTVTLLMDVVTDTVAIKPGVTLDLNGYTLTANLVVAMSGAAIRDGGADCTGGGLLKTSQNALVYAPDEGLRFVPVWNGVDGYIFTKVSFQYLVQYTGVEGTAKYMFLPSFSNREARALLTDGGMDNGLDFRVCMTWNDGKSKMFYTYEDSLVSMVYDGTGKLAFSLTITGIEGITDIVVNAQVATETGAIVSSAGTGV